MVTSLVACAVVCWSHGEFHCSSTFWLKPQKKVKVKMKTKTVTKMKMKTPITVRSLVQNEYEDKDGEDNDAHEHNVEYCGGCFCSR